MKARDANYMFLHSDIYRVLKKIEEESLREGTSCNLDLPEYLSDELTRKLERMGYKVTRDPYTGTNIDWVPEIPPPPQP